MCTTDASIFSSQTTPSILSRPSCSSSTPIQLANITTIISPSKPCHRFASALISLSFSALLEFNLAHAAYISAAKQTFIPYVLVFECVRACTTTAAALTADYESSAASAPSK